MRTWEDALAEAAVGGNAEPAADRHRLAISRKAIAAASRRPRRCATPAASPGSTPSNPIAIDYYRHADQAPSQAALKIYHFGSPVALSRRVPVLENMGFRVISERTFEVGDDEGDKVFIHDMELENAFAQADRPHRRRRAVRGRRSCRSGAARPTMTATTRSPRPPACGRARSRILRAYGRYLQQAGIPQSQDFIAAALNRYPEIARALFTLFVTRFDPARQAEAEVTAKHLKAKIKDALEEVPNIDDDTIIRRYLNLIESSLRTNHFAAETYSGDRSLAIKLDSRAVDGLPEPRPWREIFVYGPEVEGVHLRFGPVARGGLRWSDRAQDYRTEVLGLVKAQQVKNAVIVPVGAKGGFFPKRLPAGGSRDAVFEAGTKAYVNFVSSLLSITDNLDGDAVIPPKDVVRRDSDDPYFVVAADKGTATFSDTANAISQKFGFWLDDAFASGGSAGYDHKKMGITARGAWEAVKRHFREMNRDIQTTPFTVVGVGDMSGDVFGNGMLLSEQTRLIAAFDHRDIFIDPDPDMAASMAERRRMFALPRSSWQDYDKSKLSKGGVIVSRSQKSVTLPPEAAAAIGLDKTTASPTEIMNAILKAPVDLLWFGGIGTYVRASGETNAGGRRPRQRRDPRHRARSARQGDRRGRQSRRRRSAPASSSACNGGACNSDAIDNSGGVNSSDVEVNIKIALAAAMRKGSLTRPARNKLLAEMTEEVGQLVLANNYQQTLALSLVRRRGLADLPYQARFMTALEARGLLDRAVETLPSPLALAEREARGEPLTRAELGVLLAYAKIVLFSDIVASSVPDEPHFERDLHRLFPGPDGQEIRGRDRQPPAAPRDHRARRRQRSRQSRRPGLRQPAAGSDRPHRGRCRARLHHRARRLWADVALCRDRRARQPDRRPAAARPLCRGRPSRRCRHRLVPEERRRDADRRAHRRLQEARTALEPKLASLLPDFMRGKLEERAHGFFKTGAPDKLADRLALLDVAELIPDIATGRQAGQGRPRRRGQGLLRRHRILPHQPHRGGRALDRRHRLL